MSRYQWSIPIIKGSGPMLTIVESEWKTHVGIFHPFLYFAESPSSAGSVLNCEILGILIISSPCSPSLDFLSRITSHQFAIRKVELSPIPNIWRLGLNHNEPMGYGNSSQGASNSRANCTPNSIFYPSSHHLDTFGSVCWIDPWVFQGYRCSTF